MTPYIITAIFGTIIGSFLNVCIYRIPNKESIAYPGSKCGNCNTSLKPLDLIPVLSYLFLKGKCRYCQSKVSIQYPLIELLNGALYVLLYHYFDISLITITYSILFSVLLTVAVIDYKTMRIPNPLVIFGLIVATIYLITASIYYMDIIIIPKGIAGMLLGATIIGICMLISLLLFKKQGMGMGDLKLLAMIGLFVGSQLVIYTIFIAVILGGIYAVLLLLTKRNESLFPFGPFISIGAVIGILWGDSLLNLYLNLINYIV